MNSTLAVIENRRSIRAYAPEPLSPEERQAILQAALRAPTAGNMMLYSIIEVEDQAVKDRLVETCDQQPFIAKAPYLLLFVADYQRWWDIWTQAGVEQRCQELGRPYRQPQEGDLLLACCDALIAAHSAVIAAESMGIGSCYIGDILERYEIHQALFDLPRYVLPITLVCFGRPASTAAVANRVPRFDQEFIVHRDRYNRLTPEQMERMLAPLQQRNFPDGKLPLGAESIGQLPYLRKFIADFSVEMSRSARVMLQNWQE